MDDTSLQASAAPEAAAPPVGGEQKKLWGGRFTGKTDPLMEKFNESLPFDKRMWAEDIRVGAGHRSARRCCGPPDPCQAEPAPCRACSLGLPALPSLHAMLTKVFGAARKGMFPHALAPLPLLPTCRVLQGSQAYAKALAKAGVLTDDEAKTIVEGLAK